MKKRLMLVFIPIFLIWVPTANAGEYNAAAPRTGIAVETGNSMNPVADIPFGLIRVMRYYDYEIISKQPAPDNLRFKVEGAVGVAGEHGGRLVAKAGIAALYYPDLFRFKRFRPYIEGGIGIVYSDFQIEGMAFRVNFNPSAGIGVEIADKNHGIWFFCLKTDHASNGYASKDNKGLDTVSFQIGKWF